MAIIGGDDGNDYLFGGEGVEHFAPLIKNWSGDVVVFKKPGEDVCSEGPLGFGLRMVNNLASIIGLTRGKAGHEVTATTA